MLCIINMTDYQDFAILTFLLPAFTHANACRYNKEIYCISDMLSMFYFPENGIYFIILSFSVHIIAMLFINCMLHWGGECEWWLFIGWFIVCEQKFGSSSDSLWKKTLSGAAILSRLDLKYILLKNNVGQANRHMNPFRVMIQANALPHLCSLIMAGHLSCSVSVSLALY
jgi:hypothetical protein